MSMYEYCALEKRLAVLVIILQLLGKQKSSRIEHHQRSGLVIIAPKFPYLGTLELREYAGSQILTRLADYNKPIRK